MKLISSIRHGLAEIKGGLSPFPPDPGYEGKEEAVRSARKIWWGENPNLLPQYRETSVVSMDEEEVDDDIFGVDGAGDFDPVIEIGTEIDETFPGLGGEEGKKIQQSVKVYGMDALGWYLPFHYPGIQWGIYVPVSGIAALVRGAFSGLSAPILTKAHLAFHAILNHELFHFATEYAIAQAELAHQEPWYVPAKVAFRAGHPTYCVEEEQLANAYMLSSFRTMKPALRVRGKQAALRGYVKLQPEGYRDALKVRPHHRDRLLENLARRFGFHSMKGAAHSLLWNPSFGYDWSAHFPIRPRIDWRYCPIHLVDDSSRLGMPEGWLSFFSSLSAIEETSDFKKKLGMLTSDIQRAWERTKQKLGIAITAGADFKKWDKGGDDLFSVRVNGSVRAHLHRRRESNDWLAVAIGSHKEMGHG